MKIIDREQTLHLLQRFTSPYQMIPPSALLDMVEVKDTSIDTNCKNCAAPLNYDKKNCKYCNTQIYI